MEEGLSGNTGGPVKHGRVVLVPCRSNWSSVHVFTKQVTFYEVTENTRPRLTGHPVEIQVSFIPVFRSTNRISRYFDVEQKTVRNAGIITGITELLLHRFIPLI